MINTIHFVITLFKDVYNLNVVLNSLFEDIVKHNVTVIIHTTNELSSYIKTNFKFEKDINLQIVETSYSTGYLIPIEAIFLPSSFELLQEDIPLNASHPAVLEMSQDIFSEITDNVFDFTQQKIILFTMPEEFEGYTQMLMNITFGHLHNFLHPVEQQLIEEESF